MELEHRANIDTVANTITITTKKCCTPKEAEELLRKYIYGGKRTKKDLRGLCSALMQHIKHVSKGALHEDSNIATTIEIVNRQDCPTRPNQRRESC